MREIRISKVAFGFFVVLAVIVSACGRQVVPNPPGLGPGGAPPGYLAIHFDVAAPFNFSQYQYIIVFNTTGSGVTPSTDTLQTNWAGYSFALMALGNAGTSYGKFVQFVPPKVGKGPPGWVFPGTTPQQFSFNPDSNGTGTEFSMLAQRSIFQGIPASPSPSASPTPTPSNLWTFNAFTTQQAVNGGNWTFLDSLGTGGPVDPQFVSPILCMTEPFDNTYYGKFDPSDQAAQIYSLEISNNPVKPAPCP